MGKEINVSRNYIHDAFTHTFKYTTSGFEARINLQTTALVPLKEYKKMWGLE